ncbi:hypothetical protein [Paracoccus tegillarcae]|nr:hypothetical protein [Paracoccus tegillarcae]
MAVRSVSIFFASSLAVSTATPASAYPIDCAILLCLAGGWPASAECAAARAEFIRRITPWPIEPPLQIWRCPMGASLETPRPSDRLWSISTTVLPAQSYNQENELARDLALRIATGPKADVDISDPIYDFVRSIKVYDIDWSQRVHHSSDDEYCWRSRSRARLGEYGTQGDFTWARFDILAAPHWLDANIQPDSPCEAAGRFRGVGVEWTDYFGNHGFEVVRY